MQILRSILAVLAGWLVSSAAIMAIELIGFLLFKPADAPGLDDMGKMSEWLQAMQKDPQKMTEWLRSLPLESHLLVLVAWQVGAFLGGAVAALAAGRARLVHAGIVGGLVLAGTVLNFFNMKRNYDISHPDWMIILGLLLPLPMSLLAGLLMSRLGSTPTASSR